MSPRYDKNRLPPRDDRDRTPPNGDKSKMPPRDGGHMKPIAKIRIITRGLSGASVSASSRKAYTQKAKHEEVYMVNRAPKRERLGNNPTVISFEEEDWGDVLYSHDDALLITLLIANFKMRWVLVDNGSLADILF